MVIERAMLTIKEALVDELGQIINGALPILRGSEEHLSHKLLRNKEKLTDFILVVHWKCLKNHRMTLCRVLISKK